MMVKIFERQVKLWLSCNDTSEWAHNWPCSTIDGKRLFAEFDTGGLVDFSIGEKAYDDVDVNEFNAITSDFLAKKLPKDHPCYYVCVGQFQERK